MKYILAIDQGTSSSRSILYDQSVNPVAIAQQTFPQYYPQPGWVEHNPEEIWASQLATIIEVINKANINTQDIVGLGITNQRETTIIWDKGTGKPVYPAIVWQDRRTAKYCQQLKDQGLEPLVKAKTGLLLDAYFSASKIAWILEHVDGVRQKAEQGKLAFGTVDAWLAWQLSSGQLHITDVSNASRTQLFNINTLKWDEELLKLFNIPANLLPEVKETCGIYGYSQHPSLPPIAITAIAGDQQAALFGQLCTEPGSVKCTYGTGCFLVMNTGPQRLNSDNGLLTTIAWQLHGQLYYALEGSVFISGALIQWLRDGLKLLQHSADSEQLASTVTDNGGVYFVPALTGLGAPYWDANARGAIFGLTRGTLPAHIVRAALESIAFQVDDVLDLFTEALGSPLTELKIDGGVAINAIMAQFQADISQVQVIRPTQLETTALGITYLAGLGADLWTIGDLQQQWHRDRTFAPQMPQQHVDQHKHYWHKAVQRSLNWLG